MYNGATYYIDVFGKRFQSELEALKKDVGKWQNSPEGGFGPMTPAEAPGEQKNSSGEQEIDRIPPLEGSTGTKSAAGGELRERK